MEPTLSPTNKRHEGEQGHAWEAAQPASNNESDMNSSSMKLEEERGLSVVPAGCIHSCVGQFGQAVVKMTWERRWKIVECFPKKVCEKWLDFSQKAIFVEKHTLSSLAGI